MDRRRWREASVMAAVLALLSMWTGATKAVSVCGVNGALAAHPSHVRTKVAVVSYFVGLYLGAVLLVGIVAAAGSALTGAVFLSTELRTSASAVVLIVLGTVEAVRGDTILPHIAWAVPRTWMRWRFSLALFGFIRGLAIFNHSPFASMHAWLVVVFLMPSQLGILAAAALLAAGLAAWSIALGVSAVLVPKGHLSLVDSLSAMLLDRRQAVARVDGIALVVMGCAFLVSVFAQGLQ